MTSNITHTDELKHAFIFKKFFPHKFYITTIYA